MNYYQDNSNANNFNKVDKRRGLSNAARVCGIISLCFGMLALIACCLGYLSIPLGALGILFAVLCRRQNQALPSAAKAGLITSVIGLILGIVMLLLSIYSTITNPIFWDTMQETYEQYEELYEEMYGIEL